MTRNLPLAQHVVLFFAIVFSIPSFAQLPAFPGAEGFGKYATGGRNGSVYHVTNLNDSGAGSLRDAVSSPNRIVVFDVAGVIKITARMIVSANIYLAGQTAPGEGITVYGNGWTFTNANNTICRYMKIRMGIVGSSGGDANGLSDGHDIIFDHCSVSWGRDENFSINSTTAHNVTIQNCIVSQGLLTHSAGGLIQCDGGITLYRNVYADNGTRNNKVKGVSQYVNNLVYNWSAGAYIMGGESSGNSFVNVTNNCFIQGPVNGVAPMSAGNSLFHIFADDNIADQNRNGVFDPYTLPQSEYEGPPDFQATPYAYPTLPTIPANTLISNLLPDAGASLPYRDFADYYIVNEIKTFGAKGALIANESTLPFGAPTAWSLWPGVPRTDADNDGMPDDWEIANGTSPGMNDAMVIAGNGYTNIENYINSITASNSQDFLRAPMKLRLDSATQTTLNISWLDYTEKEQGYIVERKVNGVWGQIGTTGVNVNYFVVTGLQPEEVGTFRVKAFNVTMESDYSNELIAKAKPVEVPVLNPATFVPDLTWTGAINQDWDKTTNNWNDNSNTATVFADSSKLLFPEAGEAGKTVNITAQMGAGDILVNSNGNYTLSGVGFIAGNKSVNKIGAGTLSLQTNNIYTGATVLRGGTIEFNTLANGGAASSIGSSPNYGFNWVWKGGKWVYTGSSVTTDRSAVIDETTEFNVSNSASTVTLSGVLSGEGGLTKSGPGKLVLKSINPYAGETIINGGTIEVTPVSSATEADDIISNNVAIGTSNILRLHNGTYKTSGGSTTIMENYPLNLYVDDNTVNGFEPFRNANLTMTVHGNGTLTYAIPYLRELIQGDWSDFTGTLVANGINATDGSILMIDNGVGFPSNRVVTMGNTKIASFDNNDTLYFGGLSGNAGTMLSCGGTKIPSFGNGFTTYVVGAAGTDETFSGVINNHLYGNSADGNGTTTIIKEGNGLWRLNGTNTYIGTTTIRGGKLIINGNNNGNGKVTVNNGAILAGKGSITGEVVVAGTLEPGDSSINTFILKDKLTLQSNAITSIDVNKTTNTWDKISVTSNIAYNGVLKINFTGVPASGDVFKIFTTPAAISGSITQFDPATPGPGLFWKFKQATGELAVQTPNFVEAPTNLTLNALISTATLPGKVNCSWVDNSDNEDYFVLERSTDNVNFVDIAHPAAGAVNYSDVDVLASTTYFYRIKAHSPLNESAYSSIVSVTTPSPNALPTLSASPSPANNTTNVFLNGSTITFTWTANYADSFSIYLGTNSNALTKLADIQATSASYTPATLDPNTKYYWRIDAINANGTTTGTVWNFKTANIPVTSVGDYRSVASGNWGSTGGTTPVSTTIWEVFDGANWNATTTTMPSGSTPTVTIRTGHIVKLNATSAVNNVVIESGASLISGTSDGSAGTATQRNIRVISSINNFGTVGSSSVTTDRVNFEGFKDNGTIYITGTSTYFLNTFTVNGIAVNTDVVIDANINLVSSMRANFSTSTTLPWTGAPQNDDNITITINEGKTVTIGSSGFLQVGSSPTTNTIGEFGTYTYNINGTLDMRSTGTSCIVGHASLAKVTTINVNGTWLMGNAIRLIPSGTAAPAGSVALNIGTNGIVDAGARTIGSSNTATNMVVTNSAFNQTVFFNITGGGLLKTKVSTSDVSYPIGSGNVYSPVKLNNSGTADIIGVGVKTNLDYTVGDATKVVNNQYTVVPATPGVTNLAISLGWITASQAPGFNPSGALVQGRFNNATWSESAATLSGAGNVASPYFAKVAGNTTFGTFAVANATALLDVVAPDVTQPQDIIASNTPNQCSADINFSAQASDNFAVTSLKYYLDYNLASQQEITFPRAFAVGAYIVTVVAKDASNNTTTKTFAITVNDTQKPGVMAGTINSCFSSQEMAEVAALAATIYSDNCTSNTQLVTVAVTEGTCDAAITVTVTDAAGNSDSVVYHTKIDNTKPVLSDKPADATVSCDQVPPLPAITAIDNCDSVVNVTATSSSTKGSDPAQSNYYNYTITRKWEAVDGCGNDESHTQTITVHDVTNPIANCKSIVVYLGSDGTVSITPAQVDNGSSDNCSPLRLSVSPNIFSAANVGVNPVTLTIVDVSGNTSTCQASVTVVDNTPPIARCKPATINLVNGVATITAATIDNGSSDASGIKSLQVSKTSFTCADIGTITVVLTVTDNNNNVSTCSTTVTVVGEIPSCSITSIPSNNTYTGGVNTNLYLGYGPQSTTLRVLAPESGAPYTYSWLPATGLSNTSSNAPVFTPTAEGTYTFTVSTRNKYGCTTNCSITICVLDIRVPRTKGKLVYICQQFGHSGNYLTVPVSVDLIPLIYKLENNFRLGSCNQTSCSGNQSVARTMTVETTDYLQVSSLNIAAFPNPSSGSFTLQVQSPHDDLVTISIVNLFGQVVYKKVNVDPNSNIIISENLAQGEYFVEAIQAGKKMVLKLIRTN